MDGQRGIYMGPCSAVIIQNSLGDTNVRARNGLGQSITVPQVCTRKCPKYIDACL